MNKNSNLVPAVCAIFCAQLDDVDAMTSTPDRFHRHVDLKTGKSWEKFFEAYLYSRQVPVLKWYFGTWDTEQKGGSGSSESFVAAEWINVPDGFSMPVTLTCRKSGLSETIDVTTHPRIFRLNKFKTCDQLSCNVRHSYFTAVGGKDILNDPDAETIRAENSDPIARNTP